MEGSGWPWELSCVLLAEAGVAHGPRPQDSHTAQTQAAKSPATAREPSCGVIPGRRGVRSLSSGPLPATVPSCGLQGRGGGATPAPAPLPHASGPSSMRRWSSPQGWHRGCTRASGAPPTGMGNRCWQPPEDRAHPAGGPGLVLRPPPPPRPGLSGPHRTTLHGWRGESYVVFGARKSCVGGFLLPVRDL